MQGIKQKEGLKKSVKKITGEIGTEEKIVKGTAN